MRIISGYAKGRRLLSPPARDRSIRPTSDRAREALFSIIAAHVREASVLDLFAGTGALGIEALSRGARYACFVDSQPQALEIIKKNMQICLDARTQDRLANPPSGNGEAAAAATPATVIRHDLRRGLPFFSGKLLPANGFDLIFLDPPYSQGLSLQVLRLLDDAPLFHPRALLVVEERAKERLPERLTRLALTDQRQYGEAGFWFYQPL